MIFFPSRLMTLVGLVIIDKLLEGIMNFKKIIRIFILSFLQQIAQEEKQKDVKCKDKD